MIDFDGTALAACIAAFGEPATYQPGAGAPISLTGIFNEYATDQMITDSGEMRQVSQPTLGIRVSDLGGVPNPCRNEAVIVRGQTWQIAEPVLDGFGHLLLKLKRTGA